MQGVGETRWTLNPCAVEDWSKTLSPVHPPCNERQFPLWASQAGIEDVEVNFLQPVQPKLGADCRTHDKSRNPEHTLPSVCLLM